MQRIHNYLYKTIKFSSLCLRQIFTEVNFYLLVLSFNMISIVVWTIFVPYKYSGGVGFFFSVIDPMLLTLGWVSYLFRNSTLYDNLSSTGTDKNQFYLAQIITTFITTIFLGIVFLIFLVSFNSMGVFLESWVWDGSARYSGPVLKNWLIVINYTYLIIIGSMTTFSMYFLIHAYVTSIKSYYIVILIITILGIVLGGILNSYFDDALLSQQDGVGYYPQFSKNIYPEQMFIPSLFYPYFGVNQMYNYGVALASTGTSPLHILGDETHVQNTFFNLGFDKERIKWTMLFLQPYIFIVISFALGKAGGKINNK